MRGRWVAAAIVVVLTASGATAGTLLADRAGQALPGTTVAGRDVAGQDAQALRATVEALARERTTGSLRAAAVGRAFPFDRALVDVDVAATVTRALEAGRGGLPLLGSLTGRGGEVGLVTRVDDGGLRRTLTGIAAAVDRPARDGGFTVRGTAVQARPPVQGRALDAASAAATVTAALVAGTAATDLPVTLIEPSTTAQDVAAVVADATSALAGPYVLGSGTAALRLTPAQVGPLLRAEPVDGELVLQVDRPGLTARVEQQARALEVDARSARFAVASSAATVDSKGDLSWTPVPAVVRVVPGRDGRRVDVDAATARLTALIVAARHTRTALPVTVVEPELTTAGAQGARVRTLIGTFTTYFPAGAPRARNIARIAQLVDGTYVPAGELLSLNRAAGPRTLGRGFVADGAIVDGELKNEVGGGVSQFATTLFNAAFFAGLPIPEHKPHSFAIGRYPAGRESTVYYGAIDVKVRNDTGNGLLVRTRSTAGSVTVELYGDNGGRRVTSTSGPRRARADGGFRIAVTRSVSGGDGVGGRRVFTTSYDPVPPDRR